MRRRRLRDVLSTSTFPLDLTPPSKKETHDNQVIEGEQEETAQEEIYKDSQTKIVLPRQNVDSYIFHLPDDYKAVKILGSGAHGVVAAATTMSADKQIAIKQIKLNLEPSCNDDENLYRWKSVYRELLLLAQLREKGGHPNVIGLKNVFFVSMSNEYEIMFLTNLMETSLETLMNSRSLESSEKKWYIYQILCGLAYLHSNNIIHRDLKSANVLVNGDNLCVADLGQARVDEILQDDISLSICDNTTAGQAMTNHGVGTFIYRAPELHFKCPHYSCSVDIWSVGCIFAEMFLKSKETLFTAGEQGDNLFVWIKEVFQLIGTPTSPEDIEWAPDQYAIFIRSLCSKQPLQSNWGKLSTDNETALDLVKRLLEFNPSKRITAKEAIQHNYFDGISSPNLPMELPSSSSSFTPRVDVNQLTTTQQVSDAICNQIEQMWQNN